MRSRSRATARSRAGWRDELPRKPLSTASHLPLTALLAMHVVDRLALDKAAHPVDQPLPVHLNVVERWIFEKMVAAAGRRVAVQDDPRLLDRRLVGVDHGQGLGRVHPEQCKAFR